MGKPGLGGGSTYTEASVGADEWTLGGPWDVASQAITAVSDGATLTLKYTGRDVYLVMGGPSGSTVKVAVAGQATLGSDVGPNSTVTLSGPRMYRIVESKQSSAEATLRLTFSQGVSANAFTFG